MAGVCDRPDSGRGMDIRHLRVSGRGILTRIVVPLAAAVSACLMTALVSSGKHAKGAGSILLADNTPNPFQQLLNKVNLAQTPQNPPTARSVGAKASANATGNARAGTLRAA